MFKTKYVSRVLCVLFIVNLFIADLKPLATSYSSSYIGNIDIISNVDVSVESVEAWAKSKNATETFISLASIYKKYGQARGGVNWVLAYVQAAKETGYGRFGGVLDESFHNPCGLKVPSGGDDYDPNAHKRFDNWEQGIIAHLDHLALYAGAKGYPKTVYVESWKAESLSINETYDPRHIGWFGTTSGILGKATNAIDLGNKWAPSSSYGVDLFRMYCDAVKADYLEGKSNLESPINGFVTNDGKLNIKGWALHAFGVKEVRVLIDNTQIDTISVNESRADVNSTYPGYYNGANSGFNKIIDISSLGYGNKVLEIRIVANDNSTQVYRRNIVFTNTLESRSYLDAPNDNEVVKSKTLNVRGWALAGSGVKEVRVYVDGKDLGTVAYGAKRADVNKAYPGYSSGDNAGFEGNVNISGISEGNRKLTVKITANDGSVQNIEKTIKVEKAQSRSYLDAPNDNEVVKSKTLNVRGWALAGSGVKEVRVYVDGKDLGTVAYGAKRADVNKAYPGYSSGDNAGFEGNVNISGISEGNRKLTVKITANDGSVQNIEKTIKVEKAQSRSYLDAPNDNEVVKSKTLNVRGWALAGSGVKEVRVYVDGKDLGTVAYGAKRADVNKAYPGYSSGDNAGFEGNVNISGISEGNRKLTVKITANDGSVQNIEKTIKVEKAQSRSYLDAPNDNEVVKSKTLNVRGWALAGSGVKEVRVYVDGKDLGTVAYGAKRADVNKAYPGYSSGDNAGFEGNVNISGISEGNRKLTVKITANDGSVQNIERSFNIENDFNYKKAKLVIVDPGHENYGGDPGTSATHNGISYIESNLNLQIAVKLKAELESRGMDVYMTRYEGSGLISQDSTESLKKRVALANEKNADFFVSIHHNSFTNTSANGFEVYYSTGTPANLTSIARSAITEDGRDLTLERSLYSTRSVTEKVKVSKAVATEITNEASSKLNMYNRGAKDSNFYVCKNTNMPSILVENGFLTNPTEAVKASSSSHQQKLAQIIADKVNNALK